PGGDAGAVHAAQPPALPGPDLLRARAGGLGAAPVVPAGAVPLPEALTGLPLPGAGSGGAGGIGDPPPAAGELHLALGPNGAPPPLHRHAPRHPPLHGLELPALHLPGEAAARSARLAVRVPGRRPGRAGALLVQVGTGVSPELTP